MDPVISHTTFLFAVPVVLITHEIYPIVIYILAKIPAVISISKFNVCVFVTLEYVTNFGISVSSIV